MVPRISGKERKPVLPSAFAYGYMVLILVITLLSREDGSHLGLDLTIGSTWGINARNNAYVLENVLLFVPFGNGVGCRMCLTVASQESCLVC